MGAREAAAVQDGIVGGDREKLAFDSGGGVKDGGDSEAKQAVASAPTHQL